MDSPAQSETPSVASLIVRILRFVSWIWRAALLLYYGASIVNFVWLIISSGSDVLGPSQLGRTLAKAFFFDSLFSLASHYPAIGIAMLTLALILTLLTVVLILLDHFGLTSSPPSVPAAKPPDDPRIRQVQTWIEEDPTFRIALLPVIGASVLPLLRDAVHVELIAYSRQQTAPLLLGLGLGVVGVIGPIATVVAGITQALR